MRVKVFAVNGVTPVVDPSAFVHPSAVPVSYTHLTLPTILLV